MSSVIVEGDIFKQPKPDPANDIDPNAVFVSFMERFVCVALDMFTAFYLAYAIQSSLEHYISIDTFDHRPLLGIVFILYFAGSWALPWRGTPWQLLLGQRVVDARGGELGIARALLRAGVLTALIAGCLAIGAAHNSVLMATVGLASLTMAFLAAITPYRQSVHDLVAGTHVVRRKALSGDSYRRFIAAIPADGDAPRRLQRPKIRNMIGDAIIIGIPVFLLYQAALITNDRDLRYRIGYAVGETSSMRVAVEAYHSANDRFPDNAQELGFERMTLYPDGGYYELEDDGVIRIRFTVKPELTQGSIVMRPAVKGDELEWTCHAEGDFVQAHLIAWCRD